MQVLQPDSLENRKKKKKKQLCDIKHGRRCPGCEQQLLLHTDLVSSCSKRKEQQLQTRNHSHNRVEADVRSASFTAGPLLRLTPDSLQEKVQVRGENNFDGLQTDL